MHILHLCRSAGREAETSHSRRMSLQNLQADGALLGAKSQRTPLLHGYRPCPGRAALRQQSLRRPWPHTTGDFFYQRLSPKRKTGMLDASLTHFREESWGENTFFICISKRGCVDKTSLLYQWKTYSRACEWLLVSSARSFTFALTTAWMTRPSCPCLWFHWDPACLSAAALSQRHCFMEPHNLSASSLHTLT